MIHQPVLRLWIGEALGRDVRRQSDRREQGGAGRESHHEGSKMVRTHFVSSRCCQSSANTYSAVAWRWSFSSGVFTSLRLAVMLGPEATATYCFPLTSNVIGGAEKPEPTLNDQSCSRLVSSYAAIVPSISA